MMRRQASRLRSLKVESLEKRSMLTIGGFDSVECLELLGEASQNPSGSISLSVSHDADADASRSTGSSQLQRSGSVSRYETRDLIFSRDLGEMESVIDLSSILGSDVPVFLSDIDSGDDSVVLDFSDRQIALLLENADSESDEESNSSMSEGPILQISSPPSNALMANVEADSSSPMTAGSQASPIEEVSQSAAQPSETLSAIAPQTDVGIVSTPAPQSPQPVPIIDSGYGEGRQIEAIDRVNRVSPALQDAFFHALSEGSSRTFTPIYEFESLEPVDANDGYRDPFVRRNNVRVGGNSPSQQVSQGYDAIDSESPWWVSHEQLSTPKLVMPSFSSLDSEEFGEEFRFVINQSPVTDFGDSEESSDGAGNGMLSMIGRYHGWLSFALVMTATGLIVSSQNRNDRSQFTQRQRRRRPR